MGVGKFDFHNYLHTKIKLTVKSRNKKIKHADLPSERVITSDTNVEIVN
jgi:hypothetical protein